MSNRTEELARYAALIARLRQQRPEWLVGYAPVSEATVRAAEQRMGYALPRSCAGSIPRWGTVASALARDLR
jgi:hypothetical protein